MSTYSLTLKKLIATYGRNKIENWFSSYNLEDFLTEEQILQISKYNVWSKEKLAKKIVDHYLMREIGFETPELFEHYAKTTMNEIMEEYLLKIYTKFLEYDPLSSVDYVEEFERTIGTDSQSNGKSNSNSSNNASGLSVNSDTPQGQINKQNILNGAYASNTTASETESAIEDETITQNSGSSNTIERYKHSMKGDNGVIVTNQYLVREFRELAISFDLEIINKLSTLFMGIY